MSELTVSRNMVMGTRAFVALLEMLDKMDSTRLAYTRFRGKDDILSLALDSQGDLDPKKASENLMVMEVDPKLADEFKTAVTKAGIPISWPTYIEPAKQPGDLAKMHCFIVFPRSETPQMEQVIKDFTDKQRMADPMSKEEMLDWLKQNQAGDTQVGKIAIDRDVYDFMSRTHMLNIPRTELGENKIDRTMEICVPAGMGSSVMETVKTAEALYSGSFRTMEDTREESWRKAMEQMLAGSKNDRHLSMIVDRSNPSEYVTFDRDGYSHFIDTPQGPQMVDRCLRKDRNYEQSLYDILCGMHACKEYEGTELENMEKLHALQKHGPELDGITVEERVHQLKRRYIEEMTQAGEIIGQTYRQAEVMEKQQEAFKGRMKDDIIRMQNSLDEMSADGLGLSAAAGDLRGDMHQIKGMILSPVAAESTKDLSDLNDSQGWKELLEKRLLLDYRTRDVRDRYLDLFDDLADGMSQEEPEVQRAFIREFEQTTRDIFERDYRYESEGLTVETVDLREELAQSREKETELDIVR